VVQKHILTSHDSTGYDRDILNFQAFQKEITSSERFFCLQLLIVECNTRKRMPNAI
jgi:hypothetical protein